jgi:hypothetical protein
LKEATRACILVFCDACAAVTLAHTTQSKGAATPARRAPCCSPGVRCLLRLATLHFKLPVTPCCPTLPLSCPVSTPPGPAQHSTRRRTARPDTARFWAPQMLA